MNRDLIATINGAAVLREVYAHIAYHKQTIVNNLVSVMIYHGILRLVGLFTSSLRQRMCNLLHRELVLSIHLVTFPAISGGKSTIDDFTQPA